MSLPPFRNDSVERHQTQNCDITSTQMCDERNNNSPIEDLENLPAATEEADTDVTDDVVISQDGGGDECLTIEYAENDVSKTGTEPEVDDEARSEATLRFTVEKFSQLTESALSPASIVRNLPWRILVMPRNTQNNSHDRMVGGAGNVQMTKCLGYFLQCNGESESASWSCQAQAELRILSVDPKREAFSRKITHSFNAKENDWGYATYKTWDEVVDPEKAFCKDDKVTFEVKVVADAPHGVFWDSKRHTGYVGLKNQGATCYMNSLLQVLFFTNKLRKSVYKMPTEADDSSKSVGLALQRVFYDLQFCDKSVGTKKLTKSFGWEAFDSFMQHDVQEFLRVLMDKLEIKMKGTSVEGQIPRLFEGEMISYIRCKNVNYTSSRAESFYDIQLSIKGKRDIYESFADYVHTESLDGENKYDAGSHGLQDADKGIIFTSFPPVLHLHLMRFQYDPMTDSSVKFNDRFEFPRILDLSKFLSDKSAATIEHDDDDDNDNTGPGGTKTAVSTKSTTDCESSQQAANVSDKDLDMTTYVLHAVLVHSGDNHGGHYVVFINPACDGKWCKFDDDVVSRCTDAEAIRHNFGGGGPGAVQAENGSPGVEPDLTYVGRHSTNAYMLVYIRQSALPDVLCSVPESHIPPPLLERLSDEKHIELARRREKNEAHFYASFKLILEDQFVGHQGNDLFDPARVVCHEVRVKRNNTLCEVMHEIAAQMKFPVDKLRLWDFVQRSNQTYRAAVIDVDGDWDKSILESLGEPPHTFFLEVAHLSPPAPLSEATLAPFDKKADVLFFFRYYDPIKERVHYMGHIYVPIRASISVVLPELLRRAQLVDETLLPGERAVPPPKLALFEEIRPNQLERIERIDTALDQEMDELMDGDIIVFQKEISDEDVELLNIRLPSCLDYFADLFYRIDVCFVDKTCPSDMGFVMTLSLRLTFGEFVQAVAQRLGLEARKLQLFRPQNYREAAGTPLKMPSDSSLKEFTYLSRNRNPRKLFYQKMTISLDELENKRPVRCTWLSLDQKEETELTVYPNKTGSVADLLGEVKAQVTLSSDSTGQLRLLDIISHRITEIHRPETRLHELPITNNVASSRSLRVEEIPADQLVVNPDQMLVSVVHFQKDISSCFSHPFLVKISDGQTFESIRSQLQKHLNIPDKEFEKYTPAVITSGHVRYFNSLLTNKSHQQQQQQQQQPAIEPVEPAHLQNSVNDNNNSEQDVGHGKCVDETAKNESTTAPAAAAATAQQQQQLPQPRVSLRDFVGSGSPMHHHHSHHHHLGNHGPQQPAFIARPYIGLEHVNKNSKRARYNYTEKAIKIYN